MTTIEHPDATRTREISRPAVRAGHVELPDSPAVLTAVLAHLRGRARSHPDSPATGLHPLSDDQWRTCITELRRRGSHVTESIGTRGDRVANQIGYILVGEASPTGATAARRRSSARSTKSGSWLADRSPALAP